jgi:DNA-directed RNA polymerase subunit K/omega
MFGDVDSKFRFVILASKRAKQILKGAEPRIKTKSKNPIRIAQNELRLGVVDYEIVQQKKDEALEPEDQVFIHEELEGGVEGPEEEFQDIADEEEEAEVEKEEETEEEEQEEGEEEEP